MEWQPIETAPRDGRDFIVGRTITDRMFIGYIYDDGQIYNSSTAQRLYGATHWMPLPPPP